MAGLMHEYWLAGGTGTIHVDPECRSARRSAELRPVASPNPPEVVWDLLWHNHHLQAGVLTVDEVAGYGWGDVAMPVLGLLASGDAVDQEGYGVRRWGCLHCLEPAAIARGWTNLWPPDPSRRHR